MMITDQVRLAEPLKAPHTSELWLADQLDWKKKVVVKLLITKKMSKGDEAIVEFLEHFAPYQEIETPHAVQVFDYGVTDDFAPFLVMDRLVGESMAAQLRRQDHLPPEQVARVVTQIANALEAAHREGLVHHGLSPDNVFSCKGAGAPTIKVLNFGVASFVRPDKSSEYASPEQYLDKRADERADLWSLGAVAYVMLTGQHAIDGHRRRMLDWTFEPPSELWLSDVPPEVDDWFAKALHRDPAKRFDSATEMARELERTMKLLEPAPEDGPLLGRVIAVGSGDESNEAQPDSNVVLQPLSDDAPGITIDVDDD